MSELFNQMTLLYFSEILNKKKKYHTKSKIKRAYLSMQHF